MVVDGREPGHLYRDVPGFAGGSGGEWRSAALDADARDPGPTPAPAGPPRGRCLVIGAGGLGAPVLLGLAAAGVAVRVVDDDVVDAGNLQRQLLYRPADVGRAKVDAARDRIAELGLAIEAHRGRFDRSSCASLLDGIDVVIDGCDDVATRFLANDACVIRGVPLVHGAALRFTGQVMTVVPRRSACLRCLFEAPPVGAPTCAETGVLGAICGATGALMVERTLRVLSGAPLADELTVIDALTGKARAVPLRRDVRCAVCGEAPSIREVTAA